MPLLAGYAVPPRALRRAARRRRRAAPALAGVRRARRRLRPRTLLAPRRRASRGRSTRTASPTTSTRRPTARRVRGASTCCRFIVPAAEWERARARPAAARAAAERGRRRPLRPAALLRDGLLPPALVFGHPGLPARRATASRRPAACFLHLVAFDLARGPDGALARRRHAHAGAVRRRLRAREPRDHVARVPRRVSRAARPAARAVLPRRCRRRCSPARRPTATRRTSCC